MNNDIAEKLLYYRKSKRYSQEELAEKIGVSRQAVSKWERGESLPDSNNLIALSRLYSISIDEMLGINTYDYENTESKSNIDSGNSQNNTDKGDDNPIKTSNFRLRRFFQFFPYNVFITMVYLLLSFFTDRWDITWIIFLTIPIFNALIWSMN